MRTDAATGPAASGRTERTAAVLMVCTAASRALGFVRAAVLAAVFGAGGTVDVFTVMFQVPNTLRRLLAEGAFSAALVPALARQRDPRAQGELAQAAFGLQLAVTVPLIVVAVLAAAPITRILVAFPESEKMAGAVGLFRVMVPYAALAGGAAVLMGGLHARDAFVVPALAPLLFSVGVIACVLVLAPSWGIYAAAAGVIAGGVLQFLFQVPLFVRRGFSMVPRLRFDDRMRRILRGWGPAVASALVFAAMQQISFLLASGLEDGSTSAIFYAVVFFQLPLGVLSVSVVTAAFPRLAEMAADNRTTELRRSATDGMVTLAALLVPAAVAYLLLGDSIVHAALQRRRFDAEATELTASVLRGFAIGLPSVGVFSYLQRLCYALDAPRRALWAAIVVAIVDVALSLWWKETALGVAGLALANSAAFSAGTLLLALPSRLVAWRALAKGALQVAAGATPAGALMWIAVSWLPDPREGPAGVEHVALLVGVVAAAALVTITLYRLVGLPFVRRLAAGRPGHPAP